MKKKIFDILILAPLFCFQCSAQISNEEILLLQRLDSVQKSSSVSKYFGELYFKTTLKAADFFLNSNKKEKNFITRLETRFASFFFKSSDADSHGTSIPAEWQAYYTQYGLSPVQYKLLGINAHINGDIWQALTAEFSLQEIRENRESYFRFQKGLLKIYNDFYKESFGASRKIRLLSAITIGLDKLYGKWMLEKWRKRQMKLAVLFYTGKKKFNNRLRRLQLKMEHINRLILHHL